MRNGLSFVIRRSCLRFKRTARGSPMATTLRKTSAKSSAPPATSARRMPMPRSERSPLPATSRNPSNGLRNITIPNSTSFTTTTATVRLRSAASSPATPSKSKAASICMRLSGMPYPKMWIPQECICLLQGVKYGGHVRIHGGTMRIKL